MARWPDGYHNEPCANCGFLIHDDGSGAWFDGAGLDFCEDGNPHTPADRYLPED